MPHRLSVRDRRLLILQRQISYLFFPIVALGALFWLRVVKRLTLAAPGRTREQFRQLVGAGDTPVLVCSNHLTLVDSVVLAWGFQPVSGYLRRYSLLPWNVPEKANFSNTLFRRVASFLGKAVYVTRGGPREEVRRTLEKIVFLLRSGELVSIFPEGGRSRTGRVDTEDFAYGVGQILQAVPEAKVLCAYLRGRQQEGHSDFPATGEEFSIRFEVFQPTTSLQGLRGARDLATQIVNKLAEMEEQYFADRERPRRPPVA